MRGLRITCELHTMGCAGNRAKKATVASGDRMPVSRMTEAIVGRSVLFWITASLVVTNAAVAAAADHISTRCLHNDFITTDRSLLPFDNIVAFNDSVTLDTYPLVFIVNNSVQRQLWCSNYTGRNYVEMIFEEPVVIEGVASRGAFDMGLRFFVANFSLLFSSVDGIDLELYNKNFIANSPLQVYTIVDSIAAKKVRFEINSFGEPNAEFCWQLQLVGCRADEVIVQKSITTMIMTATQTETVTVSPSCTVRGTGAFQQSASTGTLAGGVVLLAIGAVLIIIAVLMCVIMIFKRTKSKSVDVAVQQRHPTIVNVENTELYTMSTSSDGALLNNQLYDMEETTEALPEYATVDKARGVKTTPNKSYRALDHQAEEQGEEEERNYSNIDEVTNGGPVVPSADDSTLNEEARYSSIPEGAGRLSTEATSTNSVEPEGEYSVPTEVLADDSQDTEANNYETIPVQ